MTYRIISADCHIDMTWMPGDLWVKNAPARFRDQVPQVRQTPDGPRWYAEEKELGVFGGLGFGFDRVQRGFSKHVEKMFEVGFYEGGPHPTTPDLRLKDQDYPGTKLIPDWPTWDLPIFQWARKQGGVVGFAHSGWGLKINARELPSLEPDLLYLDGPPLTAGRRVAMDPIDLELLGKSG